MHISQILGKVLLERIQFTCPDCQTKYSALPELAGKEGKCKNCGAHIVVPKRETKHPSEIKEFAKSDDNLSRYWFGYIYAILLGYLALVSFWNFLSSIIHPDRLLLTNDGGVAVQNWTFTILSLVAAVWFAYVCVRLFRQKYTLTLIYTVASLHAVNVLIRGIIPMEIFYWLVLSGCAIVFFRKLENQKVTHSQKD